LSNSTEPAAAPPTPADKLFSESSSLVVGSGVVSSEIPAPNISDNDGKGATTPEVQMAKIAKTNGTLIPILIFQLKNWLSMFQKPAATVLALLEFGAQQL